MTIYPMNEEREWVASTETDVVSTFDPETLEIKAQFNHSHNVAVNMATAHAMVKLKVCVCVCVCVCVRLFVSVNLLGNISTCVFLIMPIRSNMSSHYSV